MFLNNSQEDILIEIANYSRTHSIASLGKKIYDTYISSYQNLEILKIYGYIDMRKRKNKVLVTLTNDGHNAVKLILLKRKLVCEQTLDVTIK